MTLSYIDIPIFFRFATLWSSDSNRSDKVHYISKFKRLVECLVSEALLYNKGICNPVIYLVITLNS